MQRNYFGTDGIRGRVGQPPITPDLVLKLGWAAGRTLVSQDGARRGDRPGVLIGKDTRISGYLLEAALEAGLSAAGVDVHLCGPLPTAGIAYLTRALRLSAGIVISASHNPFDDNGMKFFSASGAKLPDEIELSIERRMNEPLACVSSAALGKAYRVDDAAGRYVEFCKSTFPNELDLHGLRIVVDCANGAAYHVAPPVLHELGADVVAVASEPDGMNINAGNGATHPQFLAEQVRAHKADLGIALDGDGDRCMLVDEHGVLVNGDGILTVLARDRAQRGAFTDARIVATVMSNRGLHRALREVGVQVVTVGVGDRRVVEALRREGLVLGGEITKAVHWLDDFAKSLDMSYDELMAATEEFVYADRVHTLGFDTPDHIWENREQFWKSYELVTASDVEEKKDVMFFRCAC